MSSGSRSSYHQNQNPSRRVDSVQSIKDDRRRSRAASRVRPDAVSHDDAYSFALRVAFLNYLLQPRKKRKEYVNTPKPVQRSHTSGIGELMKEFMPTGSGINVKLPHSFRGQLEKRMTGVLRGIERLPGYNDAAVKRTFAEAYTAFTSRDFQKSIDKDRKVEPLILIFYSAATKAQGRGRAPEDHSWKPLVDRHLAMFVRLVSSILRDHGDRDRAELIRSLETLESKLLTNDQNLSLDTGQEDHSFIEVEVPLSYEVKDMHMVQTVAKIFGLTNSQVQNDIDRNTSAWTEVAALQDFKAYQIRLSANMAGTLRKQDFDLDESFEEWKKAEGRYLAQIFQEILSVRPDLRGSSSGTDKALPARPQSLYGEEQAYTDLGKMVSSQRDSIGFSLDLTSGLGSLMLDDTSSIRSVDEPSYTFIPPDPRAVYKTILQYAMSYDQLNADPEDGFYPFSEQSSELLVELATRWRIPQITRHVTLVEVAVRKFLDQELNAAQLDNCLDFVKAEFPEPKKTPPIYLYTSSLLDVEPSRWTMADFAGYQQALREMHDALLRDLFTLLTKCYEPNPPSAGVVMTVLMNHVYGDPSFPQKPEDATEYSQSLEVGLREAASKVYREYLDSNIPRSQGDWNFAHVVKLGQAVVGVAERIKRRYRKNPEIMGVSPFKVLVETIFPSFEEDAQEFIKRVLEVAKMKGDEGDIELQDGFDLYKELVEIRKMHVESLPGKPFAFHIESLLDGFVWRWIKNAEERMKVFVEEAIKQDQFKVRTHGGPDAIPTDEERHSVSIIDTFTLFNQTVDQVYQLGWDDDVHHAKFMTALAKAFAAGLGRYCEIVEGQFAKEMERQTAQEVAAAAKTTQEKFFQYAKDAWNTKEKVEPFQFLPEVRCHLTIHLS